MGAYILRRLLLVIPTLLGIMIINFALTQFVPGGPIEQILAQLEGQGDVFEGIAGGAGDADIGNESDSDYVGGRGLPPEFIAELEREFGFDKPPLERFLNMMWNYIRFDFGESYFRSISVFDLVAEKMPVSITLGLWSTLIAYLVSIPLGIKKAVRDGSRFDTWTSGAIIVGYAIPGFLFAILLIVLFAGGSYWRIFPLRGLTSTNFEDLSMIGKVLDYVWHIALPVLASTISAFATLTLLTKNSFLDEIKKQYVITAKAKGLSESKVLYGHVFRNAMLIVISGFPALFIGVFFGGSLII
jgi:microcin C transport system permease protein